MLALRVCPLCPNLSKHNFMCLVTVNINNSCNNIIFFVSSADDVKMEPCQAYSLHKPNNTSGIKQ